MRHPFVEGPTPQTVCLRSESKEWEPAAPGSTTVGRRTCLANSTRPPSVANGGERTSGLPGISTTLTYIRQPDGPAPLVDSRLEAHVAAVDVRRGEVDHPAGFQIDLLTLGAR
jgi:hypothetical protein